MKLKKLLASILCVAMVLSTMGITTFAEGEVETISVSTAENLATALTKNEANIAVILEDNIDLPITSLGSITAGSGEYKLGGENTQEITIDLNQKTLNVTTTYWSALGSVNPDATITVKNGTMVSTGNSATTWNANDLRFCNCNWVFEDVTFNKEVALDNAGKSTTMNDVTIKGTGDYYALWITAEGQTVNIDGLVINTEGRGIKIDEQYVDAENTVQVALAVSNSTFKTAKKAAIVVKSVAGADIVASNNNIENVNADTTNLVWVDSDLPASYPKVKVTIDGEPVAPYLEDAGTGVACIGNSYYMTLTNALDAAQDGDTIDLLDNTIALDGQTTIDKDITIINGTFDITDAVCTTEGIIYIDNKTVKFNNVDFVGSNFTSAFGVIFANHNANVTLDSCDFTLKNDRAPLGGTLKGNDNASFTVKNCTFDLENPSRVLTNITLDMSNTTINAYVTDPKRVAGDLNNHAFRNMVGSVENSTIAADGFETGIKNDTGALIVDNSTITLKNSYNGANLVISGENGLSLKTGYYSFNPINYLADGYSVLESDKTGFFKVGETPAVPETVPETKVDVKDPTVIVPEDSGITEAALKTAVESVATQESLQSATAVAVQKDETLVGTVDNAKEELERENIAVDNETVTVIVKPYLEVEVLTVEAGSITLNIVPKCDVIATTAEENEAVNTEGTEKNAVVLEEGKTLEVVTPMTITIALPADFASVGDTIYINHVKDDGSTYIYDAVVGGTTGALTATFTNPNGFSTFTATKASEAVVKIGDIGYKTLEEAVGKVKADETIVLLDDNAEEVTVARDISFILDKDSNEFTGSISAGDNTTVTTSDDGEKTTYSFDYTAPSIPVGSGGTGAVSFIVDFRTNGGSIVSSVKVKKGEKVIRPEDPTKEGYTFGGWFTDEALKKEYDFDTKVQKKLVLYAKWIEEAAVEPEPELPVFTDVKETDWFYESVMTAFKKGLMNGVSETEFAPDTTLTRAMLVTILYRAEGEPATNRSIPFADIEMGSYYANAVIWAAQNGIVNGTTETTFAPDSNITREQVAAILYRYAIYKGMDAVDLSENLNFADSDDVSEYAISALNWATGCGLVTGYEDNTLRPLANTTRAEAATLLQRFIETDK